ncbi:MAG: response regulator, partial [Plesiomonas sp.]
MQKSISVMILDDHEIVREGMLSLLKKEERISVIGSYSTVASLTKGIKENKPDLVIVDYILGKDDVDGLNLIKRLTTRNPELLILVVSSIDSSTVISLLKRTNVKGFISKGSSLNTLVDGIKKLARGEEF